MILYKQIDVAIQSLLILTIAIFFITEIGLEVIIAIIILGIVQLISMFIHLAMSADFKSNVLRKIYYYLLIIAFLSGLAIGTVFADLHWDELKALAFFTLYTLAMALYYFFICLTELINMRK